jgi:hypothetical protein
MTALRADPDYIEGYETRWYRRRPKPETEQSPAYRAGYAGGGVVTAMFREAGFQQNPDGEWERTA